MESRNGRKDRGRWSGFINSKIAAHEAQHYGFRQIRQGKGQRAPADAGRDPNGFRRSQRSNAGHVDASTQGFGTEAGLLWTNSSPAASAFRATSMRRKYGADPADVQQVEVFAGAHGLAVSQVNLAARSVVLTGKCADFEKAFQVQLARYEHQGCSYRGRTGAVSIPAELNGIVSSVHGLDNRPQAKTHFRRCDCPQRPSVAVAGRFLHLAADRESLQFPHHSQRQGPDDWHH